MTTDWENRYQLGDTPWDKGAAHPALVDFVAGQPLQGAILVPGCGTGYDVRALAHAKNIVLGVDIAPSAIKRADSFIKIASERYELADLFQLPARLRGKFDWVFEHTCFCAIDPARHADYVQSVNAALKPGGKLLAIFYLDPGPEPGPPFGITTPKLDQLFNIDFTLLRGWIPARTFPGREQRELMRLLQKRG